jgi:DNA repair exonuclease SbcCD nuclease subunit
MQDIIFFTDIHYGNKRNSLEHNQDCDEFIEWVISVAKERGIKRCGFLGDWHHNRHTINVETLKYSFMGMHKLNSYFDQTYFTVGNHDMYYRETRDVNSLIIADGLNRFTLIDKPVYVEDGDILFLPWLVNEEWKEVKNLKAKYICGHFELPTFYLNTMITMPDHGELKAEDFNKDCYVFSGHFHKRQNKNNIWYIGNAFPHTFDDTDDDDRGCMILGDNGIEFIKWDNAPKYRKFKYEDILGKEDEILDGVTKIHAKIIYNSSEVTPVKMNLYREMLKEKYDFRTIDLVDNASTVILNESTDEQEVEEDNVLDAIDATVIKQIRKQESDEFDIELLVSLYEDL